MSLSPGTRLGPYEIRDLLGAGGMGEVYRAHDPRLGREVAVKVLPAECSRDADRLRRFEHEAQAAGRLNHPNIMAVLDVGCQDTMPYVVSELLEGETLREAIRNGLPPRKAVDCAVQIAQGLAAAHEKGMVHRDLKPENVFVTRSGLVKILDFGLAKLRPTPEAAGAGEQATATQDTRPGTVLGTAGYMSPEQVRGEALDHRSDIFSLGAILYEMLARRRAFTADTAAETMTAVLRADPPPLPSTPHGVSPALERIVRRCLEKRPGERFHSAEDVAFALQAISEGATAVPRRRAWAAPAAAGLIAAAIAVVVLGTRPLRRPAAGGEALPIRSIAVLPLENLSRDPGQDYFADGMTEALIGDLAKIGSLRVISRTSAMRFKGISKPLPEIARELSVDAIVEGSVLRSGDRVRITAQLIRGATDEHIWNDSYERDLKDVLALQSEVARAIAGRIRTAVTPEEKARLGSAPPQSLAVREIDPRAHEAYLKGRYHLNKRTGAELLVAIEYFEAAIRTAPRYAPGYAGLAKCYLLLPAAGIGAAAPKDVLPKAKEAARHALAVDDSLSEAHSVLGYALTLHEWDWTGGERSFERALALDPSDATAHFWYGAHLAARGRLDEAIASARRARALDPVSPIVNAGVAWMLYLAGRYDEAVEHSRQALALDPAFAIGHLRLGTAYEGKGMLPEAIAELRKAVASSGESPDMVAALGHAHATAGDRGEARKILAGLKDLSQRRYVSAYHIAVVHAGLREKDEAFEWLQKAYEERSWGLAFLNVDPDAVPLRSDPRFSDLVHRLGLAE
jgi:TolB-like protein/Flp pilus assembly protein TadD